MTRKKLSAAWSLAQKIAAAQRRVARCKEKIEQAETRVILAAVSLEEAQKDEALACLMLAELEAEAARFRETEERAAAGGAA